MDDALEECYRIKEEISLRYDTVAELSAAVRQFAKDNPLPPTPPARKTIPGIPPHLSVSDDDEMMAELRKVKEKLSEELGKKRLTKKTSSSLSARKSSPKSPAFRSNKNHRNPKR